MDNVLSMTPARVSLTALWEQVLEKHLHPEDEYEVVALLESFGWTDNRVLAELGLPDVFELARELVDYGRHSIEITANDYTERPSPWSVLKEYISQFIRGTIFALPMVLSIVAMLTLRFSLWSYQYLSTRTATAIAVGTLLSFISVGGFMQAMARQGYFYMFQGHYQMMRKMTLRLIMLGMAVSLLISMVGIALDVIFPELPYDMLAIALLYYLVLNTIWLTVAVLYILRKELWFTVLLTAGIGLVFIGFRVLHVNILLTQLIAMTLIALASLVLLRYFFYRAERANDKGINPPLPRLSVTAYNVAPYFAYGTFYFLLLFIDRVIAWSTHMMSLPFVIWFRGDYELGLDFALVVLTIPMGVSEIIVSRLMTKIWTTQKNYLARDYRRMNGIFTRIYRQNVLVMASLLFVNAVGVYLLVHWILNRHFAVLKGIVYVDGTTNEVFIVALVAYSILALGLLHAVVMFSVSRPELVLRPVMISIAINFLIGFVLTRWFGYSLAVWGLLASSICFVSLTSRNVRHVLNTLDFHMYFLS